MSKGKFYGVPKDSFIIWDGHNTNQVIEFCCAHDHSLCTIHSFLESSDGAVVLRIEPADIMRGGSVCVLVGERIIAKTRENGFRYLKIGGISDV